MNLLQKGLYWVKGYATGNTIYDIQSELTDKEIVGEEINFRSILNLGYTKGSEDHHIEFSNKTTMLGVIVELPDGVVGVVKGFDNGSFNYVNNIVDVKTNKPIKSQQNLSHNWFTRFNILETNFPYKATCILSTPYKESDYYIRIYKAIDTSNKYAYCITSNNKKLTDDNLIGGFISDEILEPEMVDEKLQPIIEKYKYESSNSNSSMNIDEEVERKLESIKDYFSEENVVDIDKMGDSNKPKGYVENINKKRFHIVRNSLPVISPFEEVPDYNMVELSDRRYSGGYFVSIDNKGNVKVNTKVNHIPTNIDITEEMKSKKPNNMKKIRERVLDDIRGYHIPYDNERNWKKLKWEEGINNEFKSKYAYKH